MGKKIFPACAGRSIAFLIFFLALALILVKKAVVAGWLIDGYGNLVYETSGQVLSEGSDDGSSGSSGTGSSGSGSSGSGSSSDSSDSDDNNNSSGSSGSTSSGTGSSGTDTGGTLKTTSIGEDKDLDQLDDEINKLEDEVEEATGVSRIKLDDGKTEIIFGEGEKIKIRRKNGETRTDVYSGGVKVRFEQKDGRLRIKAETEGEEELDLGEQDIFKIEERIDKNIVKIATGSGNSFILARGNTAAKTNFPLSIDLATNALIVNTPTGTKTVTILPDAAVGNMLAANVIDKLGPSAIATEAAGGNLTGVTGIISLGERNGVAIYEIAGLSNQKLLGFIPVTITKTVIVSAETGESVSIETSILNTLLDAISF